MNEERKYTYKIRKGLETPLCIQGMELKYFYLLAAVAAGLIILLVGQLISLSQTMTGAAFLSFVLSLIVSFVILLGLKLYFTSKTNRKTLVFGKKTKTISNIDLLKSLDL